MPNPNPVELFREWYDEACKCVEIYPSACIVATATSNGIPSARVVLLKHFSNTGFVFFTDLESRKGSDMKSNPYASMVFYWKELAKQVRISGRISYVLAQESDEYFAMRHRESQLSAFCSKQSSVMSAGMEGFKVALHEADEKFRDIPIPRPDRWQGVALMPESFEFWTEGRHRRHDRKLYTKHSDDSWSVDALFP